MKEPNGSPAWVEVPVTREISAELAATPFESSEAASSAELFSDAMPAAFEEKLAEFGARYNGRKAARCETATELFSTEPEPSTGLENAISIALRAAAGEDIPEAEISTEIAALSAALRAAMLEAANCFAMWAMFDPHSAYLHIAGVEAPPSVEYQHAVMALAAVRSDAFNSLSHKPFIALVNWVVATLGEDFPIWSVEFPEKGGSGE